MRICSAFILSAAVLLIAIGAMGSTDFDDDGVINQDDNCIDVPNPDQLDTDADGFGDVCDNCIVDANRGQEDANGDGLGNRCDGDLNNDGIAGVCDLGIFTACLNSPGQRASDDCRIADFDSNNEVNSIDFQMIEGMLANLGTAPREVEQLILELETNAEMHPNTALADKLEDAVAKVQTARDELNKRPPDGQAAVGNIEGAEGDLEAAVSEGWQDNSLRDQLAGAARQLAAEAIDLACVAKGDLQVIEDAQQALDDGDALRADNAFKDAVSKYKDALAKAESV